MKDSKRELNLLRPFLLGNLGLFALAAVFVLYPAVASRGDARQLAARQQQIYDAYALRIALWQDVCDVCAPGVAVRDDGQDLVCIMNCPLADPARTLYYEDITAAMEDVYTMAQSHSFHVTRFDAAQWADMDGFVERRVSAAFTGPVGRVDGLVYGLSDSAIFVRTLHMEFLEGGEVTVQVEFSLFAREQ